MNLKIYIYIFIKIHIIFSLQKTSSEAKKMVKSELGRIHNYQDPCAPSRRWYMHIP